MEPCSYDIIGDIHGHADKLDALFNRLGYVRSGIHWVPPPGRQAVFVGDLIDRGPEQLRVVDTVRAMIDAGHAHAVMGNHEFNAIAWATPDPDSPGAFLRRHSAKNLKLHAEFLRQVGEGSSRHLELIEWFKRLPPMLDLGGIRIVHAWWHQPLVDFVRASLQQHAKLDGEFLQRACKQGTQEFAAMEGLTKGQEIRLPDGCTFIDHAGVIRGVTRVRWWLDSATTFRDAAVVSDSQRMQIPDTRLPQEFIVQPTPGTPVFIGHYWLSGTPQPLAANIACMDYSAARNGPLVAYRWDGETVLDKARFVLSG